MKIGFAQINTTVGDFAGNCARIAAAYRELCAAGADIVLTPELAITGYPPQDLLFKSRFVPENLSRPSSAFMPKSAPPPSIVGFIDAQPLRTAADIFTMPPPFSKPGRNRRSSA